MSQADSIVQNGIEQRRLGQLQQAEALFRQALAIDPVHSEALRQMGLLALGVRRFDVAIDLFQRALRSAPTSAMLHNELGGAHFALNRFNEAAMLFHRATELDPTLLDAHSNLSLVFEKQGQLVPAIESLRKAIALDPNEGRLHSQLANLYRRTYRLVDALAASREFARCDPDSALAHSNLSAALKDNGLFEEATTEARRAIELEPNDPLAHANLGSALHDLGRLDDAIRAYETALRLAPNHAGIHANLSLSLKEKGEIDRAIEECQRAIAAAPIESSHPSMLLYLLNFKTPSDGREILKVHRQWNQRVVASLPPLPVHTNVPDPLRRLRVGYVSSDLRNHPVGHFLKTLLSHHDHERFEIVAYSEVSRPDEITEELKKQCDLWRPIEGRNVPQVAEMIRNDSIDVLVDLGLHTGGNWLLAFAFKPAPVQVMYLAYPGTSGLDAMDYRLTDPYLDPIDSDTSQFYSERSHRLPHTYWCYHPRAEAPPVNRLPALENGYMTFASLNNFSKVSQDCLKTWGAILAAHANSRLLLHTAEGDHRQHALELLESCGVSNAVDRVEFVGFLAAKDYLTVYQRADIALDPFPYNGGTTTCDALWMGLPVVSLAGEIAVHRAGMSILSNVGLSELVATNRDRYIEIATNLASDLGALEMHRQGLRARMSASPLMNAEQFARDIENAFRQMWTTWCATRT